MSPIPGEPTQLKSVSPLAAPPKSPLKRESSPELATLSDLLSPSKQSPPSDPLAQANEVAAGLAIETPAEHAEHAHDPGNLSGAGGGIAGEGVVGGGDDDVRDETDKEGTMEGRDMEDAAIVNESRRDLETEIVKDPEQE
jgi:hypothetical protein